MHGARVTCLISLYNVLLIEVLFFPAGHFEREGSIMSQVQMGGVDLCDNLPSSEALTALTQNLNETRTLAHTQSLSPLQEGEGTEGRDLIQKASLSSNEEAAEKGGGAGGDGVVDEEEDVDEVMMEEEEEEVSEGSSSLIRCQSPDTPMTDSSYSETGMDHTERNSCSAHT